MYGCETSIAEVQDLLNEALSLPQMSYRVLPSLCILFHMCLCTQITQSVAAHRSCSPQAMPYCSQQWRQQRRLLQHQGGIASYAQSAA